MTRNLMPSWILCLIMLVWPMAGEVSGQVDVLKVEPYLSQDLVRPGDEVGIAIVLTILDGYHINSHNPFEEFFIPTEARLVPQEGLSFGAVAYPKGESKRFSFSESELSVYEGRVILGSTVRVSDSFPVGRIDISGTVSYQACGDQMCLAPDEVKFSLPLEVVASGTKISPAHAEIFSGLSLDVIEAEESAEKVGEAERFTADELRAKRIIEKGLPYAIVAFFVLGLALNLTPCVYPVLPITVSYFGGRSSEGRGAAFSSTSLYVVGIAIVFAVLGLVSGLAGKQWGFLFQSPWFVLIIAVIILSMAASMFGAFEIAVPSWLMTRLGGAREGLLGAFVMGLTVGVVIAPCAAGIIIGLVGLVAKLGIVGQGALLFFVMGLGLGLPYLFLATFSTLLTKLPKSGMWMVWIRKLFGVLLVGVALYFVLPQAQRVGDQLGFFFGLLIIFGGLLLGFLDHSPGYSSDFRIGRGVFGIVVIILGIFVFSGALQYEASAIGWVTYEDQDLSDLTAPGKPVFLDFYADWCAPCKQMERTTFRDDGVVERSKDFTMVKVDCTSPTTAVRAFMDKFKVAGMPTFVFLTSAGKELEALREVSYVGPEEFLKKLETTLVAK